MWHEIETGDSAWDIDTPALLVNLDALERNIEKMANFFSNVSANLRPHIKTHKTPAIAQKQIEAGAIGITCAKLGEAEVMADAGIGPILIANQIVGAQKIERLVELRTRVDVMCGVDDKHNVMELSEAAGSRGITLGVLVEVDVGMGRCGVQSGEPARNLARVVVDAPNLELLGLMGYEGHIVINRDVELRNEEALKSVAQLADSKKACEDAGIKIGIVSGGGTGTYAFSGSDPTMTEIQAGSYVFMDADYRHVTPEFENSLTMLSTVVSRSVEGRVIFDSGRKCMTCDHDLPTVLNHPEVEIASLSEEHARGMLNGPTDLRPGDKAHIIPDHCCTTVNLHDRLYGVRDEKVETIWPIQARGRFD